MDFNGFKELCTRRVSIRDFSGTSIPREHILDLLAVAQLAPSIENTQPWHFHIVTNQKLQNDLIEASCYGDFISGSSAFLVVTCDKSAKPTDKVLWNPRELEYSCVTAMEHVLLGATAMGLGASWVSLHHGPVHQLLNLQNHHQVIGGIMLGVPSNAAMQKDHKRNGLQSAYTFYE